MVPELGAEPLFGSVTVEREPFTVWRGPEDRSRSNLLIDQVLVQDSIPKLDTVPLGRGRVEVGRPEARSLVLTPPH